MEPMGSSVGGLSFCGVRVRALFMVVSKLGFFICVGEAPDQTLGRDSRHAGEGL